MSPEVSQAAGLVAQALNLTSGPTLSSLQRAAEKARDISDLPGWALKVLSVIRESR